VADPNTMVYVDPYISATTLQWTISISQTVPNLQVGFGYLGVVAAEIRLSTIQNIISSQRIYGNAGYAAMIQTDGIVIADPDWNPNSSNVTVNFASISPIMSQLGDLSKSAVTTVQVNGQSLLVSQTPLHGRYVMLYIVPRSVVLESSQVIANHVAHSSNQVVGITVGVGIGTLILVMFLSTLIGLQITRPVMMLSQIALQIASNATKSNKLEDIAYDRHFARDDEIGELTNAFDIMMNKLSGKTIASSKVVIISKNSRAAVEMTMTPTKN